MTKREYYDLLIKSAYDGTFPSIEAHMCLYRGPNNTKCAIGLLIPDEKYSELFESVKANVVLKHVGDEVIPEGMTVDDLTQVQIYHDTHCRKWNAEEFVQTLKQSILFEEFQDDQA